MKTPEYKAKPQPHASRAQGPFFNPNRQAIFFSSGSVQREPFFNPSRVAPAIQAKLTVGAVGDRYEQEADRVAANVVAQINDSSTQVSGEQTSVQRMGEEEENMQMKPIAEKIQRMGMEEEENLQMKPMVETVQRMGEDEEDLQMKPAAEKIQRMGMEEEEDLQMKPAPQRIGYEGGAVSTDLEAEIQSARGGGQALAPDLQAQMGQAMGADFSGVRVHTDARSDRWNQSIQAKAFTTGQDVFFRQGAYDPGSRGGQELIAHELTHVVQQNSEDVRRAFFEDRQRKTTPNVKQNKKAQKTLPTMGLVQRNVISGQADQHDWNAKHVPKRVKKWAEQAQAVVEQQYQITLRNIANNPTDQGDGVLAYLSGWNHKRFGGQYCLLYRWAGRQDGRGWFLNVKGIGRKNGNGNNYDLDD